MENKFDPFYNKKPTPLGASVVPLAVFGLTEKLTTPYCPITPHLLSLRPF